MKRFMILAVALALGATVSAVAEQKARPARRQSLADEFTGQGYGTAGCGLGSVLFGQKSGIVQVAAATTNNYAGQTFAITSGTSNCNPEDHESAASAFLEVNRVALETDISRGSGENLNTFAKLLGCSDAKAMGARLQQHHNELFNDAGKSSIELKKSIRNVIKQDGALAQSCARLG